MAPSTTWWAYRGPFETMDEGNFDVSLLLQGEWVLCSWLRYVNLVGSFTSSPITSELACDAVMVSNAI